MKIKVWQCQKCRSIVEPWRYCSVCNAHFSEIKEVEIEDGELGEKQEEKAAEA